MTDSLPTLLKLMQQLIETPSVSCTSPSIDQSNRAVIDLLAGWLEDLGFNCEICPIPGHPDKANLIATLGAGPGGLVLAGHTDTVPFDEQLWQHNPLGMTEHNERLYGLGTSDMKGFFPIAIEAAKKFLDTPLKQPLIILATADEESSMAGAKAPAEMGRPVARHAIIGEPTGMRPIRMHKGMMMEAIRLQGKSGHSSNPDWGINALDAMHDVMTELKTFRQQLQRDYTNSHFDVSFPTLNLGCIHGGDNPNRICGHSELQFDLRPLPGMMLDDLRAEIEQRLRPVADLHRVEFEMQTLFGIPSFETDASRDIVKIAEKLTGHNAGSVNFGTEAPFLTDMGMDTIVLGPGDIDQAHQPDEYLSIDRIKPTIGLLEEMIKRFCL
ncbi:Acetylornithine deacetylase [gamma proteobacterium IMCC2047]|nr:Acetylornithine deacetylase [gamma proteobacterium IMCC2047]